MKLIELLGEGKLKNFQINKDFNNSKSPPDEFCILINGKVWKKKGKTVVIKDMAAALKVADIITARHNITTQVIPVKKKGPKSL
jgi:hypothetical protein